MTLASDPLLGYHRRVLRVSKTSSDQYTTTLLNATLQDTQLSLAAMGLLVRLLSKPKIFPIDIAALASESRSDKQTIRGLLKELVSAGYLEGGEEMPGYVK